MDNSNGKNPLTKIKAVSSDPNAGEVTYAIKSENLKNYFEIDPNEGMLWVSKREWVLWYTRHHNIAIDRFLIFFVCE